MVRTKKVLAMLMLIAMLVGLLAGCSNETEKSFQSMEDFEHAKIGVLTGSAFDLLASEHFPEAEKLYHVSIADLILNLKQEKIDGILMDEGYYTPIEWEKTGLSYVKMDMPAVEYAVAFPKTEASEPLRAQVNEFIRTMTESGELALMKEKWLSDTEPDGTLDYSKLTGENGTLRVATTWENKPFEFTQDGEIRGFDMDFIYRFALDYGYALEIEAMDFSAILPSLSVGRYDLALSGITVTEERKESVLFSDVYCTCSILMATYRAEEGKITTLDDVNNCMLGVVIGSSGEPVARTRFADAEKMFFTSYTDVILALEQGKVDVFLADQTGYVGIRWDNPSIDMLDEPLSSVSNALIMAKEGYDENLLAQINAFVAQSKEDGTLDALTEKWFADTEPTEHPDYSSLTGENGTLKIAVCDAMRPTSYKKGAGYTGLDVEFLTLFAKEYGYKLDLQGMAFEALIPAVSSGKCDIGAAGITITPERAESVKFTDPHFETYGVAVIRKDDAAGTSTKTLEDFDNAVIGIQTGTIFSDYADEMFPNATQKNYNLITDMVIALTQGKIDGYIGESTYIKAAQWEGAPIEAAEGIIDHTEMGYVFPKDAQGSVLREQLNAFIRSFRESGGEAALQAKWFGDVEPTEFLDGSELTGENGTIKVALSPDIKPLCYVKGGEVVGYDVEFLRMFAREYGYDVEFVSVAFETILPGVVTGRYDMGAGGMTITEERLESVDFSDCYMTVDVVMVVLRGDGSETIDLWMSMWANIEESFNKTFIREDRWKLIVEGIGVTMLISICSAVAGTLLGFGLYLLSRSDVKVVRVVTKGFAKGYSRIVEGTPVVVILMILFYVVFGKLRDMSGIVVAIIGFALTFGAFVYDHMTVSVSSVDRGQEEAAYALGYTKNRTFFRIILPQAMNIFFPSYSGQTVELIKATAVVGYIAVNDLTKMGDIIRSNTYEAFFPLIATAVIYFVLTWALAMLLRLVKWHFEPKRRKTEDILKGVKTK